MPVLFLYPFAPANDHQKVEFIRPCLVQRHWIDMPFPQRNHLDPHRLHRLPQIPTLVSFRPLLGNLAQGRSNDGYAIFAIRVNG